MTRESISFDRIADRYEQHRGGVERGDRAADALRHHFRPEVPVLEFGIGTGVIALGMKTIGFDVIGVDLAPKMAARAAARIGARVTCADAARMPFPEASFEQAYSAWVLHLVGDQSAVLRELARVLKPGAIYVNVPGTPAAKPDVIGEALRGMEKPLRARIWGMEKGPAFEDVAREAGFEIARALRGNTVTWVETPTEAIARVESRPYSYLWDLPDDLWAEHVEPALDRLRALPDEPVERSAHDLLVVLRRA